MNTNTRKSIFAASGPFYCNRLYIHLQFDFYFAAVLSLHRFVMRRNIDIQDQYLDIQLRDKHLTYSVSISKYLAIMFEIFILIYFNILDNKAEGIDNTTEYIRCLSCN